MKLRVTCLLVICSLCARGEESKVAAETKSDVPPPAKAVSKTDEKLDWNVAPAHWEGLLGKKGSGEAVGAISSEITVQKTSTSDYDLTSSSGDSASGVNEARVERVLREMEPQDGVRLGRSDVVFRSPILEGLVPRRSPDGASLGEKLLNLPVVRLLRPLPMPSPPGGGKYFKWGSRDKAWVEYSQPVSGPGRADNGM